MLSPQKSSSRTVSRLANRVALVLLTIAIASSAALAQKATLTNLTSDIPNVGTFNDTNLVNPWGMVATPAGPWWVGDNGTGLSTLYDGTGKPGALVVTVPSGTSGTGTPTGVVFNNTSDFKINGSTAVFLFATEDGTISGWSSGSSATIAVNNSGNNAVYKGAAIGSASGANYLYVANFHNGTVDVFDKNFAPFSFGPSAFVDPTLPSGYAPFNVQNIGGGQLAVAYAQQDADKHDEMAGPGRGYVTIYDTSGNIVYRLAHTPYMNAPWAVVVAPSSGFGGFSGDLLVGMFGSGAIAAYQPATGKFVGLLFNLSSLHLEVDGIWGLGFGNGSSSGPKTTLYFAAGAFDEAHGIFGSITCCSAGPVHQ